MSQVRMTEDVLGPMLKLTERNAWLNAKAPCYVCSCPICLYYSATVSVSYPCSHPLSFLFSIILIFYPTYNRTASVQRKYCLVLDGTLGYSPRSMHEEVWEMFGERRPAQTAVPPRNVNRCLLLTSRTIPPQTSIIESTC